MSGADYFGVDSTVTTRLMAGDFASLPKDVASLKPFMPRLWSTPGPAALVAIDHLNDLGVPLEAVDPMTDYHGVMSLALKPWGDQPDQFTVSEALERVDRWVAMGGSLSDEIRGATVCSLMARSGNASHIHELLVRGATNEVKGKPLIMEVAAWCYPQETLALLRSPAAVDLNWRSDTDPYRTPFTEMVGRAITQWKPGEQGEQVLDRLTDLVEAWVARGGDLWAGLLERTSLKQPVMARSDIQMLGGVPEGSYLPAVCKTGMGTTQQKEENIRTFCVAWHERWAGWVDARLDQDYAQGTPQGRAPLRGLWLAFFCRNAEQIKRRVIDFPEGEDVFIPLRPVASVNTEANAWMAVFITRTRRLVVGDGHENEARLRTTLGSELKRSESGRLAEREYLARRRQQKTQEDGPIVAGRRARPRA